MVGKKRLISCPHRGRMPASCCIFNCTYRYTKDSLLHFYRTTTPALCVCKHVYVYVHTIHVFVLYYNTCCDSSTFNMLRRFVCMLQTLYILSGSHLVTGCILLKHIPPPLPLLPCLLCVWCRALYVSKPYMSLVKSFFFTCTTTSECSSAQPTTLQ